jgi:hypothetical protein
MCALLMDIFLFLSAAAAAGKGVGEPCSPDALVLVVVAIVPLPESVPEVFVCCANPAGAIVSASAATARTLTRLRISILLNLNSGRYIFPQRYLLDSILLKNGPNSDHDDAD